MNYLNGLPDEPVKEITVKQASFINELPQSVDSELLNAIDRRIELMNANYNLYQRRNRMLAAIAMLEIEVKNIEDEIKRL